MTPSTRPDDPGSAADPRAHACARPSCPPPSPFSPDEVLRMAQSDPFHGLRVVFGLPRALPGFRCDGGIRYPRHPHRLGPSHYGLYSVRLGERGSDCERWAEVCVAIVSQGGLVEFTIEEGHNRPMMPTLVDLCRPDELDAAIARAMTCLYGEPFVDWVRA